MRHISDHVFPEETKTGPANIYVASSWRNDYQPAVVEFLRSEGFDVYDFKNPAWNNTGFHWSAIDPHWRTWQFDQMLEGLSHPIAQAGFASDFDAMKLCDACVLVQPCGRSAHLELGWFVGQGKPTVIYYPPAAAKPEPELMTLMCDLQTSDLYDVVNWLQEKTHGPRT